jgi:tetratricopeptide (TPR) repeat protein
MRACVSGFAALLLLAGSAAGAPSSLDEIRDFLDRDMLRTAEARLTTFLASEPDSAGARALLARLRLARRDPDGAEAAARRAVDLESGNPEYWILWGRARFEQGMKAARAGVAPEKNLWRFAQAETGFRTAQQLDPGQPDVLWWIGRAKEWQRDRSVAWQFYDAEIREFPRYAAGYRRLGQLEADQADAVASTSPEEAAKKRREALATFDEGLAQAGEDAELLTLRALLLEKLGEDAKSIESFERSVRADPGFTRSWEELRTRVDETKVLVPLAIEVLETHPDAAFPARIAGEDELRRAPRDGEKPWTHFESTLRIVLPALERHGDDEALYRIAFRAAEALIGETPRTAPNGPVAVDAFRRIHEAYAWSPDAANNLGFYFRETRAYAESLAWYLRAVDRAPESQDILNDTGLIYLFHFPEEQQKGLPFFLEAVALVRNGDQKPERGYWDALENLCKHYWEVDRQPAKVIEYARMRYETTKGVPPYNMSQVAESYAAKARQMKQR